MLILNICSKDNAHLTYKQMLSDSVTTMLCIQNAAFIVLYSERLCPATYEELEKLNFTHKKLVPSQIHPDDVNICKEALIAIASKGKSIPQRNLLYYIQHYHFDDVYSKKYIKQLIFYVLKQYNKNKR